MKYSIITLLLLFGLLYSSCSEDPCQDVICVNGNCDAGVCQCEEGFIGESCDQIDLVGSFYRYEIQPSNNCGAETVEYLNSIELDGLLMCDDLGCFSVVLTFNPDLSFIREYRLYDVNANGSLTQIDETINRTKYRIQGSNVILDEFDITFSFNKNELSRPETLSGCDTTYKYKKVGK